MTTQKHAFTTETAKVLQLVIHSLYTNKDIFIRELISNASDACDKLKFESQKNTTLMGASQPQIEVSYNKDAKTVTISDTGIGMTEAELVANLGTIAKSGTLEFIQNNKDASLIGQFGVGFYSAFMVAKKVEVISKKAGEDKAHKWESEGLGEFTVSGADKSETGTTITVFLKDDEDEYLDKHRITHIIKTYSDHISTPIILVDDEGNKNRINKASALWMRSKTDVTEEEYQEFYKNTAHQIDKPLLTMHGKAEGTNEYNYLLFIPNVKPFDLYHPDRMRRIKLYVKRVYIAEDSVDVIPRYLRFLRGVIDSEDLPLNISRESLQANPLLGKIKKSITSKVLSELKKLGESKPEEYAKFWGNFGAVIKEGLCETLDSKDPILEVCRFNSSASDKMVSIDEYIARANPAQEEIYYLSGDNAENLKNSPQLEGFIKQGIEVLFFTDTVDDFWVNVAHDYKGKRFKSITRADIDLGNSEQPADSSDDDLIKLFKTELGDKVKDVKYSGRLTESPVCLSVSEGDMDIRMERFLRENRQLPHESAKILEVNKTHPIITNLANSLKSGAASDVINLLYDQAVILEGEKPQDAKNFATRLNALLSKALAA
jgi:molecular chaperone HtpG